MGWFSKSQQIEYDALTEGKDIGQYALGMFTHVKDELIDANGIFADVKQEAVDTIAKFQARYDEAHAGQQKHLHIIEKLKDFLGEPA